VTDLLGDGRLDRPAGRGARRSTNQGERTS